MGRFSILSHSDDFYPILAYHCNCNIILVEYFRSNHDRHRLAAYNNIRRRIQKRGHKVNLKILDNEASTEYRRTIKEDWKTMY